MLENLKDLKETKESPQRTNDILQELQQSTQEYMRFISVGDHHKAIEMSSKILHLVKVLNMDSAAKHINKAAFGSKFEVAPKDMARIVRGNILSSTAWTEFLEHRKQLEGGFQ